MPASVSLSPVQDGFYLNVAYDWASILYSNLYSYAPSTTQFLSRVSVLSLLGYLVLLFLVLLTHGTIPETISTQGKALVIHPTRVFLTCAAVLGALCTLAPLEHNYGEHALASPLFYALASFSIPSFDFGAMLNATLALVIHHVATFALYAALPAATTAGYVLNVWGGVSQYRLPGFQMLLVGVCVWWTLVSKGVFTASSLWHSRWEVAATSCLLGLYLSCAFFLRGVLLRRNGGLIDERERCPDCTKRHGPARCNPAYKLCCGLN